MITNKKFYFSKYILFSALLFLISCSTTGNSKLKINFQLFKISVMQNEKYVKIINNEVILEKAPFKFIIYFHKPDGVNINSSFSPFKFDTYKNNMDRINFNLFQKGPIEEGLFNKDKTLTISTGSLSYWNYTGESEHKFSETEKRDNIIICTKDITHIKDSDQKNESIEIEKIKENAVYMIFIKSEWNKDFTERLEKKRFLLKLNFNDENNQNKIEE